MNNFAVAIKYYDSGEVGAVVFYHKTGTKKFECCSFPNDAICNTHIKKQRII